MTTTSAYDVAAIHRRTVRTLVTAQALGGIGITIGVATASLLARDVSVQISALVKYNVPDMPTSVGASATGRSAAV